MIPEVILEFYSLLYSAHSYVVITTSVAPTVCFTVFPESDRNALNINDKKIFLKDYVTQTDMTVLLQMV